MPNNIEKIFLHSKDKSIEVERNSAILADRGNGDMAENFYIFETPAGIKAYAATDRGIGKEENNDRVIINSSSSQFTVLDGMLGSRASQILAEKILANPDNLEKALDEAKSEMRAQRVNDGTCLVSAKLTPEKILQVSQVGDCGALVLDQNGKIKFSATHQVKFRSTALEVNMKEFGIERTEQRLVDTSPRDSVSSTSGSLYYYDDIQLADRDIVLLFSDALWSNFSDAEISQLIRQNKDPQNLFNKISDELKRKMSAENNIFSSKKDEVFSSFKERAKCYYGGDYVPQSDNQSLVLFQV